MTGRPSERCAARAALERILQGAGSPWVRQQARAVLASPCCVSADQADVEMELRREWWMNHGHDFYALYGDDGEMQCASCPADFKRDPLDRLRELVTAGRLARAALTVSATDQEQVKEALEERRSALRIRLRKPDLTWPETKDLRARLDELDQVAALALLGSQTEEEERDG